MNYENLSTIELRALVRERGLANGGAVASARKQDLIDLLTGTRAALEAPELPAADDLASVIARAIAGKVQTGLDPAAVRAVIDAWAADTLPAMIAAAMPKSAGTVINLPELPAPLELPAGEGVHFQFAQVLSWLRADVPLWLWGAPGAGKTHLGRQLAAAMGLECYTMSIDETTTANKLLGFQNLVSGDFVPGWLHKPYRDGGLVIIDEIDTGNPGIIAGLNALISNGHYLFPNGETVTKHPDFRVIACANTNGTGAVAGFTARQRLDAATLNRFAIVRLEYDAGLETMIACGTPSTTPAWAPGKPATAAQCAAWVAWVQSVREHAGKSVLISPRPSLLGVRALRAGIPAEEVAAALVFALCAPDTVASIKGACMEPERIINNARAQVAA